MPSHALSFTIRFLYFLCSGAYFSLGLRLPEGSWPCYKSERTTRDLWFMGDHPRFPTRAETWVFPHNPRPLVFFLSLVGKKMYENKKMPRPFVHDTPQRFDQAETTVGDDNGEPRTRLKNAYGTSIALNPSEAMATFVLSTKMRRLLKTI